MRAEIKNDATGDSASCECTVIMTRRRPATTVRGVMVKAWFAGDGDYVCRVTMPWDYAHDAKGNACKAALLLIEKLRAEYPNARNWRGETELTGGYLGHMQYAFAIRQR